MSIAWKFVFSPLIATGVLIAIMHLAVRLVTWGRARDYARHEDKTTQGFVTQLGIPAIPDDMKSPQATAFSALFRDVHQQAITAQTIYHSAVVRSGACLVIAFCAIALGTTRLNEVEPIHLVLVWLDALAMGLLFFHFMTGAKANETWIVKRIEAELLRQFQFTSMLFPSLDSSNRDYTSKFEGEAAQIRAQVLHEVSGTDTISQIDRYWADRRRAIESTTLNSADMTGEAVLRYLHKRPLRQLGWFTDSKARLEQNAHARAKRLELLFAVALALALIKLALALFGGHDAHGGVVGMLKEIVLPLLLLVTGWSAAEAAYYLNQNARSLIHRYDAQLKRMGRWFERASATLPIAALPNVELDDAAKNQARTLALEFEDLMVEELNDWIHISKTDAIEISP